MEAHVGVITGARGGTPLQINRARCVIFPPPSRSFPPLSKGRQEGIVPIIINRLIQDNPLLTPPS